MFSSSLECMYNSFFNNQEIVCVWVASLVDLRVFWQPGSVLMFHIVIFIVNTV